MHQQPRQKMSTVRRAHSTETVFLEEGLRRAYPVDDGSLFDDLIVAIDAADEEMREGQAGTVAGSEVGRSELSLLRSQCRRR